ncbi:MAG: tetratricopeptide repeat protein [Acidobacteria bacterium]|nr:tetratricopeptide repeat protein [Acidobacteriota bacterium]
MHKITTWGLGLLCLLAAGALLAMTTAPPNLERALEAQQKLAQEHPDDPDVLNDLGNLLLLDQRPEQAEEAYRQAVALAPDKTAARFNLGLLLQQTGRTRQALKEFRGVLENDPDHAWAQYQAGAIYERAGDKSAAVRHYSRAFALDPQLATAEVNPQVIESDLVVESMLRGYREMNRRPLAPKSYDDRSRIAKLMVYSDRIDGAPESDGASDAGADALLPRPEWAGEEPGSDAAPTGGTVSSAAGTRAAEPDDDDAPAVRVLTPDNIERGGTLGQAVAPGSGRSSRSSSRSETRTRTRSSSSQPSIGNSTPRAPRTSTGSSRSGRVRYVPSARSTSSLDLNLVPRSSTPAATLDASANPAG